ncbi:uncharacterized protein LOC111137831 isoform X2 [Crassostrea virginica]
MEKGGSKQEPYKVLKQMSLRRHDLERSSDKLRSDLEHLQQINSEHGERISSSLHALRREQEITDKLLREENLSPQAVDSQDRGTRGIMSSRPLQREPSILRQLKTWSTSDVIQWLEQMGLNKFVFLFQRHHVTGSDLAQLKLSFLDKYEHISVSDREELLSQIYELLRLEQSEEEDPTRISTSIDKEKYRLAKQIVHDPTFKRSQSTPVCFIPSQNSSSSSSASSVSSNTSSPIPKQRKQSGPLDSTGVLSHLKPKIAPTTIKSPDVRHLELPKGFLEKRKLKKSVPCSWFEALEGNPVSCVSCYTLQRKGGQFGVTIEPRPDGQMVISNVSPELQADVRVSDRVLELNGCCCVSIKPSSVADIMKSSEVLQMVTCKPKGYARLQEASNGNGSSDMKWQKFREFLVDFKEQDVNVEQMLNGIPKVEVQKCKEQAALRLELDEAQNRVKEQQIVIDRLTEEIDRLTEDVEDQKILIENLRKDRSSAIRERSRVQDNERSIKQGETEYYKITMKSLNMESANKEQIMTTLKEIVKEASRQKFYLDRLISLVIEESPWLLDQVNANFDETSIDNKMEEFC